MCVQRKEVSSLMSSRKVVHDRLSEESTENDEPTHPLHRGYFSGW